MISRHIPMRNVKRSSFAELTKYLQDPQNKQERVGVVKVTNCSQENALDAAVFEIEPTQRRNTRSEDDKTYHLIVSFRPGENPSQEVLDAIEKRMCAALGYAEHQRISAVHHDTDNLHMHIAINKINPTTLNIHTPFNDYKIRDAMCQVFEKEYGLERDNHVATRTQSENRANDLERHAGIESFLGWIKRECSEELKNTQNWQDFHQVMNAHGLTLKEKGNGFVITGGDDFEVKASSVDRILSRTNLEKKFGGYENIEQRTPNQIVISRKQHEAPNVKRPGENPPPVRKNRLVSLSEIPTLQISSGKRYTADPIHKEDTRTTKHQRGNSTRPQTTELYARYKNDQQSLTLTRNEAIRLAKSKRDRLIEDAKRKGKLRRVAIKLLNGPGVNKQHLYGLTSKSLMAELKAINEQYGKDKQGAYDIHKKRTWADWLQHKSVQGDDVALKELRSRNAREARKQANVLHGEKIKRDGRVPGLKPDSVTKEGTVIYRVGESAIRDGGDLLDVSRGSGDAGLQAALMMAMHRYGNKLTVNGSFDFKKRIVAVAAAKELNVTFDDPALEKLRQILVNQAAKQREYLTVPFEDRDAAKKAGAIWDKENKSWYVGPYADKETLDKWRSNDTNNSDKVNDDEQRRRQNRDQQRRRERPAPRSTTWNNKPGDTAPQQRSDNGNRNIRGTGRLRSGNGIASAGSAGQQPGTSPGHSDAVRFGRVRLNSKPNIGSLGTQPPPFAKNRLRGMQELSMVRLTRRSEMLLPRDVHSQLEQQGTEHIHPLRRGVSGGGIEQLPEQKNAEKSHTATGTAAEKYILEREEKRAKGFDITKHRSYTVNDKGTCEYAGQRNVNGETLALLKRNDEIIVLSVNDYAARNLKKLSIGDSVVLTATGAVRTSKGRSR